MIPGGLLHHIYIVPVWSKYRWEFSVMHFKILFIERSFVGVLWFGFIIMKFIWLHGFHILVHVIFMIGQTAPCCDHINKIIWVAHLLHNFFKIVSLIPISTVQDLHYCSLLEIGMWVIIIHTYLICIFVVNGSRPSKDSKVTGKRDKWDFPFHL